MSLFPPPRLAPKRKTGGTIDPPGRPGLDAAEAGLPGVSGFVLNFPGAQVSS